MYSILYSIQSIFSPKLNFKSFDVGKKLYKLSKLGARGGGGGNLDIFSQENVPKSASNHPSFLSKIGLFNALQVPYMSDWVISVLVVACLFVVFIVTFCVVKKFLCK